MWELVTREIPWDNITETQYIHFCVALSAALQRNERPPLPPATVAEHPAFVSLMRTCWVTDPEQRPSFADIIVDLEVESAPR